MRGAILGFAAGAACLQSAAALPEDGALIRLASAGLLFGCLRHAACRVVAGALLGFCWAALLASLALAPQLSSDDEGRDVTLTGTIDNLNRRIDSFVFSVSNLVERSRSALRERILRALPDKKYAGVIVALVVGEQRAIGQSDWKVFNRTGVGHVISI